MRIVFCDDESVRADAFIDLLLADDVPRSSISLYTSFDEAQEGLMDCEEPLLLFLDHDLGEPGKEGYVLARWLREHHPFGLLLPIVYLTGRETPDLYLEQQRARPYDHPSAFLSKASIAENPKVLIDMVRHYEEQFSAIKEVASRQGTRQALISLSQLEPEADHPRDDENHGRPDDASDEP